VYVGRNLFVIATKEMTNDKQKEQANDPNTKVQEQQNAMLQLQM